MSRIFPVAVLAASALLAAGCGTLTQSSTQQVLVQAVLDHQPVAGAGCLLSNEAGRWFVTTPGKVAIRKSAGPLRVDCRKDAVASAELVGSRQDRTVWGNYVATFGLGNKVDRETGRGFDYPSTLTVVLQRDASDPKHTPPEGPVVF